ncbi:MAG: permease-like cell division protein FtsX [Defluviitaleaceae bacterium]|nr:permease-like cell division protein FtsX [Defluviitaleaceae bacterium]
MKFRTLSYYLSEAVKSLVRNRLMTLASILTVFSCIFILVFSYSVAMNIDHFLAQLEDSLSLSAFIASDVEDSQVLSMLHEIESMENVAQIEYISYDEAFERALEMFANDPMFTLGLTPGIFPRSFIITMEDVSDYSSVVNALQSMVDNDRGLEYVRYHQSIITVISTLSNGIRIISTVMIIILIVLANVIIMNTIRLTINSRRNEITIMKYIGATDWFIKWPFIIEGMLIGLIGAALPVMIVWFGYGGAAEAIHNSFFMVEEVLTFRSAASIFVVLMPLSLSIGMGIGIYGSIISMRKHLQV